MWGGGGGGGGGRKSFSHAEREGGGGGGGQKSFEVIKLRSTSVIWAVRDWSSITGRWGADTVLAMLTKKKGGGGNRSFEVVLTWGT